MPAPVSPSAREVAILGPLLELLRAGKVTEISLNPDGAVWVSRFGGGVRREGEWDPRDAERLIRWAASEAGEAITATGPIVSVRLPGWPHRLEALVPPVVDRPTFSVRRHTEVAVDFDSFDWDFPDSRGAVESAVVRERRNLVVAGATGSGKTTFANACLAAVAAGCPDDRIVVIEDTPELRSRLPNTVALRTSRTVDQQRLLVSTLRLAPDRIVVGECRDGGAALTLLRAWNTGHRGGLTTLHANGAAEVVPRLDMLCSEVAATSQERLIRHTIDLVVYLARGAGRPVVQRVLEVEGADP